MKKSRPSIRRMRPSFVERARCADALPPSEGFPEWEVPVDYNKETLKIVDTDVVIRAVIAEIQDRMHHQAVVTNSVTVNELVTRDLAVLQEEKVQAQFQEAFSENAEHLGDGGHLIVPINLYAWVEDKENNKLENLFGHTFFLIVFDDETQYDFVVQFVDGNGYVSEWHDPVAEMIKQTFHRLKISFVHDTSDVDINLSESSTALRYLRNIGITDPYIDGGSCAYLAYIYLADFLCTRGQRMSKGHGVRLVQGLLVSEADFNTKKLTAWQEAIILAYKGACTLRLFRLIKKHFPTDAARRNAGWPRGIEFPDPDAIETVWVRKVFEKGVTKLVRLH